MKKRKQNIKIFLPTYGFRNVFLQKIINVRTIYAGYAALVFSAFQYSHSDSQKLAPNSKLIAFVRTVLTAQSMMVGNMHTKHSCTMHSLAFDRSNSGLPLSQNKKIN